MMFLRLNICLTKMRNKMNKVAELQQERASKIEAQKGMIEQRSAREDKNFTQEEETKFKKLNDEIRSLDEKIEFEKSVVEAQKRQAALEGEPQNPPAKKGAARAKGEQAEKRDIYAKASVARAIRSVTTGKPLEGAEKEMNELAIEESRVAGVDVPDNSLLNIPMAMRATAQTVSEDSGEYGGALVQDNAPRLQMPFAPKTFLEKLGATRWTGLTGGDVPLPVANNYNFNWLAETEGITVQKKKFEDGSLSPKRLGAAVEISNRLLIQSSVNVEQTVRNLLFGGYDRAINDAAVNGAGGNAPTGILNTAGIGLSTVTAAAKPTRAMAVELPALIEAANATEDSLGYLMSPQLKALLQNTKVDAGSGLFLMPGKDGLLGYKAVTSTLVPELTGNKVLIFGDFSQLFIGEWGSMSVLSDPYSAALNNSVRLVVNGHADVAIAQPSAFAVNKFINETGA